MPEKAQGEQEYEEEVEEVGATPENAVYGTKNVVAHAKETRTEPPDHSQKAKATKKPRHHLLTSLQVREPILSRLLPRRARLGFRHGRTVSMAPKRIKRALLQLLLVAHCYCKPAQ